MSRIGKKPVPIPSGVTAELDGGTISITGPRGSQSITPSAEVSVSIVDNSIVVKSASESKRSRQHWGLWRSLIDNCVIGVTKGFSRELQISGVGYRAQVNGNVLNLTLGLSHEVNIEAPEGITIETPSTNRIVVRGINKQQVGQIAANIRLWRPPEPFKGKGIRYAGEFVYRKVGKKK